MSSQTHTITARIEEKLQQIPVVIQQDAQTHQQYKQEIRSLLQQKNAVLVAHYYVADDIQALAEETNGFVGDSLQMARFGYDHPASTLVVAGVRFMGESAKILSPHKTVIMPTLKAECSLDISCQPDDFAAWIAQNPGRQVVVYANTSAKIKAMADWVVTSSNAIDIIDHLDAEGHKILWAPDKYLGQYIRNKTGADMVLWPGTCIVHDEFKHQGILQLKNIHPDSIVIAHPESVGAVLEIADFIGSTSQLIDAAKKTTKQTIIVATDQGIFYKMRQAVPNKKLLIAPTAGEGAQCKSCGHCLWMGMNSLITLKNTLIHCNNIVEVEESIRQKALIPLKRMMGFQKTHQRHALHSHP